MTRRQRAKAFAAAQPWVVDAIWAVCLAVVSTLLLVNSYAYGAEDDTGEFAELAAAPWQSVVGSVLTYAPLVARRRWPVAVLAVVTFAHVLYLVWLIPEGLMVAVAYLLAMYTVGDLAADRLRDPARVASVAVLSLVYLWVYTVGLEATGIGVEPGSLGWVTSMTLITVFIVVAWMLGDAAHERRVRESLLRRRAAELEAEREENARRAVLSERVRIARELHDVVAHSVSVMGIQAAAARTVFAKDPAAASRELESIEETSRSAVAELRRLLGFLRDPDVTAPDGAAADYTTADQTTAEGTTSDHTGADSSRVAPALPGRRSVGISDRGPSRDRDRWPQPGADRLGELISQTSSAGVRTDLTVTGEPRELPAAVSLSVYRIVQEALTNTLKHGRAHKAEVLLTYADGAVEVEVLDDGRGPSPRAPGQPAGLGLIGMRERAALHDGRLTTGARDGGGFKVWTMLPTGSHHDPARTEPATARP